MSDQFELAIAAAPEQLKSQNSQHQEGKPRRILQVYQHRAKMPKALLSIIEPELNNRIHRTESLVGKYDSAALIDANLSDSSEFPALNWQVYMEHYYSTAGNSANQILPAF